MGIVATAPLNRTQSNGSVTMPVKMTAEIKARLKELGVESFHGPIAQISDQAIFEPPCSIKWMQIESRFEIGAFSYAVSGFYSHCTIGRYTSIGEQVQIGRASHPVDWLSTSPFFDLTQKIFDVGTDFLDSAQYHGYKPDVMSPTPPTTFKLIKIGHDVYIGHGAFILPGVHIGTGAVVAAMSVVTKDVPPYAIVAGNPATIKRMRFSPEEVETLLACEWWNYAPWQLRGFAMHDPRNAAASLKASVALAPRYSPEHVHIKNLL